MHSKQSEMVTNMMDVLIDTIKCNECGLYYNPYLEKNHTCKIKPKDEVVFLPVVRTGRCLRKSR